MVGRGDEHYIHILAVENAPEVLHRLGLLATLAVANLNAFGDPRVVHVADHNAIDFGVKEEAFQVTLSHAAAANETEPNLVVGAGFSGTDRADEGRGQAARGERSEAGGQSGLPQKFAARDVGHIANFR